MEDAPNNIVLLAVYKAGRDRLRAVVLGEVRAARSAFVEANQPPVVDGWGALPPAARVRVVKRPKGSEFVVTWPVRDA